MILLIVGVLAIVVDLVVFHTSGCGLLNTHSSLSLRCIILILRLSTAGIALVVLFRCLSFTFDCLALSLGFGVGIII